VEPDMHPYGACYHDHAQRLSTGVIEFLKQHQINTVIVGGLALDYCVKKTVLQLLSAQFEVIVNLAATRALALETQQSTLTELEQIGVKFIYSVANLVYII
jgi:nicotinamidase/pyrazinamidase